MLERLLVCSATSEAEMRRLAGALAPCLMPGDVVRLEGSLGAGKTVFARGCIQALTDRGEEVPSPTFSLVQTYEGDAAPIWHLDLYRLERPEDIWELGFEEALESAIMLIEWPARADFLIPDNALTVTIESESEQVRKVTFSADTTIKSDWPARFDTMKKEVQELTDND